MNGVNQINIVGHLGADPEVRYSNDGNPVCTLSVATSGHNETTWHRVVVFKKAAEFASQYLKKGALVFVSGRMSYRTYEKDGQKRTSAEIIAHTLQALGSKDRGSEGNTEPPEGNQPDGNVKQDDGFDQIPF
jgi:single-strand DNA-binding protein